MRTGKQMAASWQALRPTYLKACPFCGGEAEKYAEGLGVQCKKCRVKTPVVIGDGGREAERRWQARVSPDWNDEPPPIGRCNVFFVAAVLAVLYTLIWAAWKFFVE